MKEELLLIVPLQEQKMSEDGLQLIRMQQRYRKNRNRFRIYYDTSLPEEKYNQNSRLQKGLRT